MSDKQTTGPTQTETLLGGKEIEVITAREFGSEISKVSVRQLKIKQYPALLAVQDDELKMAELYCDKPAGWAERLEMDSLELVVTEGERINQDFFSRWTQRRVKRQEKLMPGITEKLSMAVVSALPIGSPKPASNAA